MNKVVINTSPLIVLFKSQFAYLLPQLFTEIIIPSGVWDEIVKTGKTDIASQQLPKASWAKRTRSPSISSLILAWGLDRGESEVLNFALENLSYRAIITNNKRSYNDRES